MDSQKGGSRRRADTRRWFELEPPAPERLELETSPRIATVASYVFTRAAERSWQVLNQHLEEPHGSVFWIRGADALNVGLETARRTGIKSITVAIDFGIAECEAAEFFAMLAQVAASFH